MTYDVAAFFIGRSGLSFFLMSLTSEKKNAIRRVLTLFFSVPFARSVVLSGSCAKGTATEGSDIDIVVGAEEGRVWTARFFSLLYADARGVRNKGRTHKDMLCMSLFISPPDLYISDPENAYERDLYPMLAPVYGDDRAIDAFAAANKLLLSADIFRRREIFIGYGKNVPARAIERVLRGRFGDVMEGCLRRLQEKTILRYARTVSGHRRIILSPSRVETHFRVDPE